MATLAGGVQGTVNGAQSGAGAGSAFGGWGALIGGILGGAGGLAGGLLGSGGTSAADQLDMLEKYYQPTKLGWSWAQLENQVAIEQFRKQLASSAKADLDLSKAMNLLLPSYQVRGLSDAGLNPILAVLGSGFSPIQSSASASMSGGAHVPGGLSRSVRRINSAGSAMDFAKILSGTLDTELENRQADTQQKKALTDNVRTSNELVRAQAYKTVMEADLIKDKIDHGSSWFSDMGREARSGIGKPLQSLLESAFRYLGYGSPDAVKEPNGNSAKNPGIVLQVTPSEKPVKYKSKATYNEAINDYINRNPLGE